MMDPETPPTTRRMPFGQYRRQHLEEIPSTYLYWLLEILSDRGAWADLRTLIKTDDAREELHEAVFVELEQRRLDDGAGVTPAKLSRRDQRWLNRLVEAGYRAMARADHPDRGGKTADMQELNAAIARIRAALKTREP